MTGWQFGVPDISEFSLAPLHRLALCVVAEYLIMQPRQTKGDVVVAQ